MTEFCFYCGGELLRERDCTHNTREPFEYCCPTCDSHFDGGGNIIEDFNEHIQPTPTNPSENPNPNKDAESSQKGESSEGNTQTSTGDFSTGKGEGDSSDKDYKGEGQKGEQDSSQKGESDSANDFKLEPTQILASQKVLKQVESLQNYLATAMAS